MPRPAVTTAVAFAPYAIVSAIHVTAQFAGAEQVGTPTKALLMPALALAVVAVVFVGTRATTDAAPQPAAKAPAALAYRGPVIALLLAAIALSWLGDEAGLFFPFAPTLPLMLLFFGLAHLCYIWLFWRHLAVRRVPLWALAYAAWWVAMLGVLGAHIGGLLIAVAVYGVVLGGTAVAASRCHPIIVWGGVFFLASDTILAFRLFVPEALPAWTSGAVMLTYCVGQGLLAAGVLVSERTRVARPAAEAMSR